VALYFSPRGQELGHELGWSEGWQERIQARVTPSGEISDHLREKLLKNCLKNREYIYSINWISGKRALMPPILRYSHVMHIVSQVDGDLAEGLTATDAIRSSFPAGTLSGAPKIRAMEIINELEPVRRNGFIATVNQSTTLIH
jgi:hypothetical protein